MIPNGDRRDAVFYLPLRSMLLYSCNQSGNSLAILWLKNIKKFKLLLYVYMHVVAGPIFLERGFICIKVWGLLCCFSIIFLEGDSNPIISMFYQKELYEP